MIKNETHAVRMSISRKLLLLFLGLCFSFFALIGYSAWSLSDVAHELSFMGQNKLPTLSDTSQIKESVFRQQQVINNVAASTLTRDRAMAEFTEAGSVATRLLGDTSDGKNLRKYLLETLDKEKSEGHLDEAKADALSIPAVAASYQEFLNRANEYFSAAATTNTAAQQTALNAVDDSAAALINRLQKFDSTTLEFMTEDTIVLHEKEQNLLKFIAIAGLAIFVASVMITLGIIKKITGPLTELTSLSAKIASGDLTGQIGAVRTGDELEILADSFGTMSGNLRSQIEEMRKGVEMLSSAISEIGASIQEQAASAKEEAATIQEITTTLQEIQQSGTEISQRAKDVSVGAENTLDAGEAGLQAVLKTSESMERIREQVEEVAEKIVSLSEKTQAIGEIVATVNEIAEQSNILAINASIEAASAGESGSRFSVVAQEMKHLADQAKTSTRMVRGILEEIQKGINTSVMLTEEAVKRTDSGRAQASVAQGSIHKLAESIQGSVQTFQQIIAGTGQQQIGINQVVQGMQDIKQAVQQTVTGISQLEQATRSLNDMGVNLRTFVTRYKL
jgi:methyl-accepting chemotaxis protein